VAIGEPRFFNVPCGCYMPFVVHVVSPRVYK
jgi:hypothetical protein